MFSQTAEVKCYHDFYFVDFKLLTPSLVRPLMKQEIS